MIHSPKILLVQLYSNGDCLFATVVARQIKQDYPTCHLTWAIASSNSSIIDNNPYVDDLLLVDSVIKNDISSFKQFKQQVLDKQKQGIYDEIFIVQNFDTNNVYFTGSIRGSILDAYPKPITVPIQPILRNTLAEKNNISQFVVKYDLANYKHIILFEFAPQSGQIKISKEFALFIAEELVKDANVAVILSSANKIIHDNPAIIDGSSLSLRETAALSHYCTFLLGCSSGITWSTTSDSGKLLPMVQLLNPSVRWFNPISFDFKRFGIDFDKVIELVDYDEFKIIDCVKSALSDFDLAKARYNQKINLSFRTSRTIVYNFLLDFDLLSVVKHINLNFKYHGFKISFFKEILLAFIFFPFYFLKTHFINRNN